MSGCPKSPGRDCGCESGLESESECDPCQGRCGEWQKTPNFVRSLPGRHVDPCTEQMLWKGRIIFGSTIGSLIVGGWLYHKYLHYAAAREAAKVKRARAKPKSVNHEHMGIMGPSSTLVPKVKELANVESDKIAGTDIRITKEVNQELLGKAGSDTVMSSEVKKELAKVADNKRVGPDIGSPKEDSHELQRKAGSGTVLPLGVKKELTKVDAKKKVEPIGNPNKVKDEHVRVKGLSSTLVPKVKELADVGSNKRVGTKIGKRKEVNEELKKKTGSDTGISSGVKRDLTKVEAKKNIEPIGNPKRVNHDNLKVIVPNTTPRPEVKKETELEVACGATQEGEKRKTGEGAVITILTQGKNGRKVKRRGWK